MDMTSPIDVKAMQKPQKPLSPSTPEGSAASGKVLGEIAGLSPEAACSGFPAPRRV